MGPAIPVEVCELIIDYVALENIAPLPSGLAPQYHFQRRRYHLSTRILVNGKRKLEQTAKHLKANVAKASVIRELYVCSPPRPYSEGQDTHSFSHWSHLFPLRLSGVIPALDKIILVDLNWRFLHPSFFVIAPQLTSTVTTLWMYNLSLTNPGRLTALVSMFPSLQALEVVSITFDSPKRSDSGLRRTAHLPNLHRVKLTRTSHIGHVLSWLSEKACNLRSLAVDVHEPLQPLRDLLLRLPLLSELHMSFARFPGANFDEFIGSLDFGTLRSLRSLTVDAENDSIPALVGPLSSAKKDTLGAITLQLQTRIGNAPQFIADAAPRWAALDASLSEFKNLERVTVRLRAPEGDYAIEGLLPKTHSRRIANITLLDFDEWPW
ncbi:hypothetical protein PsYK624_035020 [Phanerochaete sordida]|uniref:F-box domain-containing protein n=1 Tax=Phanerochaete sordida TaxID=48140 RepID=A0A9P3G3Y2_9APHY|nr:hypothetical protein PsYK624_035020 [Phanerochaete sordida]